MNQKINLLIKKGSSVPVMAHDGEDACYDLITVDEPVILGQSIDRPLDGGKLWKSIDSIQYRTNLYCTPESQTFSFKGENYSPDIINHFYIHIFPRSSIYKYNLLLANSVPTIDRGYRGEIILNYKYCYQPEDMVILQEGGINKIYFTVNEDKVFHTNDKIAQFNIYGTNYVNFVVVDDLGKSYRNSKGFGSSGN